MGEERFKLPVELADLYHGKLFYVPHTRQVVCADVQSCAEVNRTCVDVGRRVEVKVLTAAITQQIQVCP